MDSLAGSLRKREHLKYRLRRVYIGESEGAALVHYVKNSVKTKELNAHLLFQIIKFFLKLQY